MKRRCRFLAAASVLILAASCKTLGIGGEVQSIDKTVDGMTTVYFITNGRAYRYVCKEKAREESRSFAALMKHPDCSQAGSEMAERDLEEKLVDRYLELVESKDPGTREERLNKFENDLKRRIFDCMRSDETCDPLAGVLPEYQVLTAHWHAYMFGLLEEAFGGPVAGSDLATEAPQGRGFALAEGEVDLGSDTVALPVGTRTRQVVLRTSDATPVNLLEMQVSSGCLVSVSSVMTVEGQNLAGPNFFTGLTPTTFLVNPTGKAQTTGAKVGIGEVHLVLTKIGIAKATCEVKGIARATGSDGNDGGDNGGGNNGGGNGGGSDLNPLCANNTPRDSVMKARMAQPSHRKWHHLWHGIRNAHLAGRLTKSDMDQITRRLGSEWQRREDKQDVGEEFLQMHHVMIANLTQHLQAHGCTPYNRWSEPPSDKDEIYPVFDPRVPKNGGFELMRQWHQQVTSPEVLSNPSVTLGAFGEYLENGLHNSMHMRHANPKGAISAFNQLPAFFNISEDANSELNRPSNDWLGHPYSSHVNPFFWRLHGYIEDRLNAWLAAHNFKGFLGENGCNDENICYKWRRPWAGVVPANASDKTPLGSALGVPKTRGVEDHADHETVGQKASDLPDRIKRAIMQHANMFPTTAAPELKMGP